MNKRTMLLLVAAVLLIPLIVLSGRGSKTTPKTTPATTPSGTTGSFSRARPRGGARRGR
jgi:hypothetical protein